MIRTQQEILDRINEIKYSDLFQSETSDLVYALDYEHAKQFLEDSVSATEWKALRPSEISEKAKEYMEFFLEKITYQRGLSVIRAVDHYRAWKWLLGHEDWTILNSDGGWYQQGHYNYLKAQMDNGEWDQMTQEAIDKAYIDSFPVGLGSTREEETI
jgi:hypothetical protein